MQDLKKSFDAFLKGEYKVAILKGGWGVGKTHFWNEYINKRILDKKEVAQKSDENLSQIAYSYISLFGKTSLSDVRKSIFHSFKPISSDTEIKDLFEGKFANPSSLLNLAPWMNWVTKNAQNISAVGQFSNIISSAEYSLVDNYVICFDDLERKADTLTMKEIMGLIDELATRKNCKVILIFNENELDENINKKEFDSYREKIVDIELNYEPTCIKNMKHVFPDDFEHLSIIENVVNELNINNIRVLRKIHQVIEEFDIISNEPLNSLVEEFITHAAFLCWGYFIYRKDLSFESIKSQLIEKSWMSFISDEEKEKTPSEEIYSQIAINFKLYPSRFDLHIIQYLEQGFVNKKELEATVLHTLKRVELEQFDAKFRNAWDMYTDSFEDNHAEFIVALKDILNEGMNKLDLSTFSSIINILKEFEGSVSFYIENYIETNNKSLKIMDLNSWVMGEIKNEELKAQIYKICKENKHFSIDDVAERIAVHQAWNPEDIDFLSSQSKDDFRAWMKRNPKNLPDKIRKGLFTFVNLKGSQSNQKKIDRISTNVIGALKGIASENALNKKRVKNIYGVE